MPNHARVKKARAVWRRSFLHFCHLQVVMFETPARLTSWTQRFIYCRRCCTVRCIFVYSSEEFASTTEELAAVCAPGLLANGGRIGNLTRHCGKQRECSIIKLMH